MTTQQMARLLPKFGALLLVGAMVSCTPHSPMEGLWLVESVQIGEEDVTPNGRWIRFHADSTQESGNGWLQHSVGYWHYNPDSTFLTIQDTNGIIDEGDPFKVKLECSQMEWARVEEGQDLKVSLKKIKKLPQASWDQLSGVWALTSTLEDTSIAIGQNLFIRWDRRFRLYHTSKGSLGGRYHVHAHRSELRLSFDGEECLQQRWKYEFDTSDKLILTFDQQENPIVLEYTRINQLPKP